MPRGDGTGPSGAGPGSGGGGGRGRMGGFSAGPGGNCICPNCRKTAPHERGVPCSSLRCPQCGAAMTRG